MNLPPFYKGPTGAALLSAVLPGLGLFLRGYRTQAYFNVLLGLLLFLGIWGIGHWGGIGSRVLLTMLFVLPWWAFQIFQTSLAAPQGIIETWKIIWARGHDIRYLGGLFMVAAFMDLYIIVMNPDYHLHVFCTRPTGLVGTLVKIQSPLFHILIGYGFLRVLRWSLLVYLVYAGYGLTNALVNFACEGYGRIRTVFFLTLLLFTIYVFLRRHCFVSHTAQSKV